MWDDWYGKQPNPYSVEDFRRILASLRKTDDGSEEYKDLIQRTQEALFTESDEKEDE